MPLMSMTTTGSFPANHASQSCQKSVFIGVHPWLISGQAIPMWPLPNKKKVSKPAVSVAQALELLAAIVIRPRAGFH
jgi:hypothetical protein